MKQSLMFLVFVVMLAYNIQSLAEGGHSESGSHPASGHRDMGSLFPQPQPDPTAIVVPETPELLEPAFFAVVSGTAATLKWNAVKGAETYHVQLATDPNFKWLVSEENMYNSTTYQATSLTPGQFYFWRVCAEKMSNHPQYTKSPFKSSMFQVK